MDPSTSSSNISARASSIARRKRSLPNIDSSLESCFENDDGKNKEVANENNNETSSSISIFSPVVSLPLLVFIDMFAVALVVPLLFQYYKHAGVTSATQRELLSSVFSASQIVGGILLGALTDAGILGKKTVLFVSFGGSALAYLMITYGGFAALVLSRIMVGLVKQTMTITTSMLTQCTTKESRAKHMGRLESSATAAWILGPSTGAVLFKYVDQKAPALLASSLFVLNIFLGMFLLQGENGNSDCMEPSSKENDNKKEKRNKSNFMGNLKTCFTSRSLGAVIVCLVLFGWMYRTTSYSNMGSYYEDMYRVETHTRGYIQSYQRTLSFVVQSALIGPVLKRMGGESRTVVFAAGLLAAATFLETQRNFPLFVSILSPAIALSTTMMSVSLRSLLTQLAPQDAIFSIFAALDVLQNASAVTVPFYRTFLFQLLGGRNDDNNDARMEGDPDPVQWVITSGIHWTLATVLMGLLLLPMRNKTSLTSRVENKKS
ncbi:tetracycline resistance protein [Nitzschia inconspicua]|uniref:Tetracycline resistance protein n=1 Tax=Nitzschia inconspicua TaxID=303405 RepID=A0A9K3LCI1_9STRA|nr:tetracycline resistance protein [Nitzschia inconspicua]